MALLKRFFLAFSLLLISLQAEAQFVSINVGLNVPPPPPLPRQYYSRPACPSPNHIWREGRWVWDGYMRTYTWYDGYWEFIAPRPCETHNYNQRGRGRGHYKKYRRD